MVLCQMWKIISTKAKPLAVTRHHIMEMPNLFAKNVLKNSIEEIVQNIILLNVKYQKNIVVRYVASSFHIIGTLNATLNNNTVPKDHGNVKSVVDNINDLTTSKPKLVIQQNLHLLKRINKRSHQH